MTNTILVVGALGLIGRAAIEHFSSRPGWRAIGISRRAPDFESPARFVSLDLQDAGACRARSAEFAEVTHILYAALYEKPSLVSGWQDPEQIAINMAMLRNIVESVESATGGLKHITLLQGTKAYGSHIEPMRVPGKERWPRHPHENFYWHQEDYVRERAARSGWSFTILRPQAVLGLAVGSPMNLIAAIGLNAAIRRERGEPLYWSGGGRLVTQASDAALLARAAEWAGTEPRCAGETYNIGNGDMLVWEDLFPSVATFFGMDYGGRRPERLAETMPAQSGTWDAMVAKYGLRPYGLEALAGASFQFADWSFRYGEEHPAPSILSTIKSRQHGFADCLDTEDAVLGWLRRMQDERLLPR